MVVSGVKDFIKNSPNIETLKLSDKYINDTTIEAFIKRANIEPKIRLKFFHCYLSRMDKILIQVLPNLTVIKNKIITNFWRLVRVSLQLCFLLAVFCTLFFILIDSFIFN
jgi:hypothetical protein